MSEHSEEKGTLILRLRHECEDLRKQVKKYMWQTSWFHGFSADGDAKMKLCREAWAEFEAAEECLPVYTFEWCGKGEADPLDQECVSDYPADSITVHVPVSAMPLIVEFREPALEVKG